MRRDIIDITFQRFGRWFALMPVVGTTPLKWLCRCDCGNLGVRDAWPLRHGKTHSCGCWKRERASARRKTHGMSKTREFHVWNAMMQRCSSAKSVSFRNYGARGISVCDAWKGSFETFFADMGPRPSDKHTLERVDNSKGYSPDNCVWATRSEQLRNTRRTRMLTYNGRTQCVADWARELGLKHCSLLKRLKSHPVEVALSQQKLAPSDGHAGLRHES